MFDKLVGIATQAVVALLRALYVTTSLPENRYLFRYVYFYIDGVE